MTETIGDHAIIGNGRSAALVSRTGAIDWLCWPRFDDPSLFGAILSPSRGGAWRIAPVAPARVSRRYLEGTNVLETRFEVPGGGVLAVTDFMPVGAETGGRYGPEPENEIVRLAECTRGEVEVEVTYDPRPGYGREGACVRDAGAFGYRFDAGRCRVTLLGDVPLAPSPGGSLRGRARLRAGEAAFFSLTCAEEAPAPIPPLGNRVREAALRTAAWWRRWSGRARYEGPYREAVVRSALALKLLVFSPSGAILAAPTTSLPERIGGDLNWDYRFCWLRDASMTVRALSGLGYRAEATAFAGWLLHATRLTLPALRILYDVYGREGPRERTLPHLEGHRGSRPVRAGNGAGRQTQLDVYGEAVDAVFRLADADHPPDRETRKLLRGFGEYVCRHGREPDDGIWEERTGARHYTHSRVLCWVALDRLLRLHRSGLLPGIPVEGFRAHRDRIGREVRERGFHAPSGSYARCLDGVAVDASLLLLPWYGFEPAASPRMRGTWRRIRDRLGAGPGLLYRHEGSRVSGEGAFVICGFWAAEYLASGGGSPGEARATFEAAASRANDAGLFAEEVDPRTGEPLGNFPQGFSHVGLIGAAMAVAAREEREAASRRGGEAGERMRDAG